MTDDEKFKAWEKRHRDTHWQFDTEVDGPVWMRECAYSAWIAALDYISEERERAHRYAVAIDLLCDELSKIDMPHGAAVKRDEIVSKMKAL